MGLEDLQPEGTEERRRETVKILITGCRGQLGTEIQKQLREMSSPVAEIPEIYRNAQITAIDIDTLDLSDRSAVNAFFEGKDYDLVINCAAMTNVDGCESDFETAFKANALAPRYLAEAAERIGAKLVHVSTDYVFSGDAETPRTEADATIPVSAYGKSKLAGENYVRETCSRYFIVRTAWLYGYNGKNFVRTIINAAKKYGKVRVVNDQLGNPTSAVDLATAILRIGATEYYGIYHGTNNGICSWYDFTCEIFRLAGIDAECTPCTSEEYGSVTKRPAYSALDNLMMRCTVGDCMRPWQDAIREYITTLTEKGEL